MTAQMVEYNPAHRGVACPYCHHPIWDGKGIRSRILRIGADGRVSAKCKCSRRDSPRFVDLPFRWIDDSRKSIPCEHCRTVIFDGLIVRTRFVGVGTDGRCLAKCKCSRHGVARWIEIPLQIDTSA